MRENVYWFFICQNITNLYICGILLLDSKKFGRNNMDFEEVIKNRYSCKKYSDKKVEKEKLDKILEAGRLAPTAKNLQEYHIYVIQSEKNLKKVDEVTPCRYGASTVLLVTYDKTNVFTYPGGSRNSGIEDATIVATHMMLAAKNQGVESCWINFLDPDITHKKFRLPAKEEVLMMLDIGYPAEDCEINPLHNKRKDLSETVTFI